MNTRELEIKYAIALTLVEGVGSVNAKKLLAYCGDFTSIFKSHKSQIKKIPGIGEFIAEKIYKQLAGERIKKRAEQEQEFIEENQIQVILYTDSNFPFKLKQCEDCPIVLYAKGNINFNNSIILSVVGTRKVTERGKENCKNILNDLKYLDPLVVSGMAYGVDICAHKICVENKMATIGVLAHGLDRLYPAIHNSTADKMMEKGGLLTEFMSGTNPDRENFPKRNRIIAGLSDATLVVESAKRGGSLITAEIANSYSRDVFAVPGRITDQYSEGCNFLIKTNKAHLLNSAADIVYLMNWELDSKKPKTIQKQLFTELPDNEQVIFDLLSQEKSSNLDELSQKSSLPTHVLAVGLLQLEFKGLVKSLPGSSYRLS